MAGELERLLSECGGPELGYSESKQNWMQWFMSLTLVPT